MLFFKFIIKPCNFEHMVLVDMTAFKFLLSHYFFTHKFFFLDPVYELCGFVFVMKEEQENTIGMMQGFSLMIQEELYVQTTKSMK